MRTRFVALLASAAVLAPAVLLGSGCIQLPYLEEGGRCNAVGVCGPGLACRAGTCVKERGLGSWLEMTAPPLKATAIWGAGTTVLAVGDGVLRLDGETWRAEAGVPQGTYRAVWGRSADQLWLGGDDLLLARTQAGWTAQELRQSGTKIEHYAVLALGGDASHEWAIASSGGKSLLLENAGSYWKTVFWYGGTGQPARALPAAPSLLARSGTLLIAGGDELLYCYQNMEYGVPAWEAVSWRSYTSHADTALPPLRAISGGPKYWVGAGGASLATYDDASSELGVSSDSRDAAVRRDASGVAALDPGQYFVVGRPLQLRAPDPSSGVTTSPVEVCDASGCSLERVPASRENKPLQAVWAGGDGRVIAVGDGVILRRTVPAL